MEEKKDETVATATTMDSILEWERFYREEGMLCNLENISIPPKPEGFDRLLIIPQGITIQQVYEQCARRFRCWKYTDDGILDDNVPTNDRDPKNGSYAIWVRDRIEADEEHEGKSADDLQQTGVKGITLLERLVYELKYFKETGER